MSIYFLKDKTGLKTSFDPGVNFLFAQFVLVIAFFFYCSIWFFIKNLRSF